MQKLALKSFLFIAISLFSNVVKATEFPLAQFVDGTQEKPVIFNIWATWCKPCVKEMPELEELAKQGDYHVYALSIDRKAKAAAERFWKKNNFEHMVFKHDASGKYFYEAFAGEPIPTTFVLDESLLIKGIERGERQWAHEEMRLKIKEILKNND